MSALMIGHCYTRRQIHKRLGGGVQEYLPHIERRVVCGCFNPRLNPGAPGIVLPGKGPGIEKWAAVFAGQSDFVPIFLKRATNEWEYAGDYRVKRRSDDPSEISQRARRAGRNDVSQVLFLEPAK